MYDYVHGASPCVIYLSIGITKAELEDGEATVLVFSRLSASAGAKEREE